MRSMLLVGMFILKGELVNVKLFCKDIMMLMRAINSADGGVARRTEKKWPGPSTVALLSRSHYFNAASIVATISGARMVAREW
jgi:hypothetical protein